ncbi:hypothetical protein H072_11316 [Dactylellina haptotyla CBS 200.50]|uniref:Amine oxidase domain-containing protein n=1 Tax=Dactylellina haptotyla (strain CBS 200.50) TaxID=1284197 RepID=S7ZY29_DACHA|nr:hypothetical protein H072_11316 [Dactylellina haptotyla CBS 200.50]
MAEPISSDKIPFTAEELNRRFQNSPRAYWDWITGLDWDTIRANRELTQHDEDVREEFADTLVYQEVLRELLLFIKQDHKNWDAVKKAIAEAFKNHDSTGWANEFQAWANRPDVEKRLNNPSGLSKPDMIDLLKNMPLPNLKHISRQYGDVNVGIVGAGVSGLYAGRLFDWLNEYLEQNPRCDSDGNKLKFNFELLEAGNRVGGDRSPLAFTSKLDLIFSVFYRTFQLFQDVGLYKTAGDAEKAKSELEAKEKAEKEKDSSLQETPQEDKPAALLKYLMSSDLTPSFYNDIQHYDVPHRVEVEEKDPEKKKEKEKKEEEARKEKEKKKEEKRILWASYKYLKQQVDDARAGIDDGPPDDTSKDTFRISTRCYGDVPYAYVKLGADKLLRYAFDPFKYLMRYNFHVGYEVLMKYESFSVREFLTRICKFDFYTINWLETSDAGTGWFDLAFTEAVIESFTFDTPPLYVKEGSTQTSENTTLTPETNWYCVEGGTGEVIRRLNDKVSGEPEYNRVVIGMKLNRDAISENEKMEVYLKGDSHQPRKYHTVINTTTLGCASRMDLQHVELQTGQKAAIRMLRYSASTKIGVKFTDPWWIKKPFGINEGGVAPSDLYSARMCVYPSYNIHDAPNRPAVLLASYCWGQDAERVGAMIKKTSPDGEDVLRDCLLRDLARLHHDPKAPKELKMGYDDVLAMLRTKYITHYSYDWNHDPFVSGAFAMFGPGQYRKMMPHLQRPTADSRLHFVGEATSNHHAWIVGALESATRAVCHLLVKTGHWDLVDVMLQEKNWGCLPGYDKNIFFWQYVLGLLPPGAQANGQQLEPKMDPEAKPEAKPESK